MTTKLSILIPTIRRHTAMYNRLIMELNSQILPYAGEIEILTDDHETDSRGVKRQRLLERASGRYLTFIDADDGISVDYIGWVMKAIESDCDCASLKGLYSVDGKEDGIFEHSLKYSAWKTNTPDNEIRYERFPNHLNAIKSRIAKQIRFNEKDYSEDFDWSTDLHNSGLIKTEFYIPNIVYFYRYVSNKQTL